MVTQYREHGNLRSCLALSDNPLKSSFAKVKCLSKVTKGLAQIHARETLHYDLHSGNILVGEEKGYISMLISDLGLSGPANKILGDGKMYGVLPYIAPEVMRGNPYTDKADIYSVGMLTWEIFTGQQPFSQCAHDKHLARRICYGERPFIPVEIPDFYKEFMCKCWNSDPLQRPSAQELFSAIEEIFDILVSLANIYQVRLDEIEMIPKSENIIMLDPHPSAVYTSRCFTTEELGTGKIIKCSSIFSFSNY